MTALQKQEMADLVQPARNEYSNPEELLWSSFFIGFDMKLYKKRGGCPLSARQRAPFALSDYLRRCDA